MPGTPVGRSNVHFNLQRVEHEACSSIECEVWSHLTSEAAIAGAILFGLLIIGTFVCLRVAEVRCREEHHRTRAEAEALAAFADRIAHLEAVGAVDPTTTSTVLVEPPRQGGLDAVEDAFASTVMALDHYEEEYDEPLLAYAAAEFGPDVAGALESNDRLTPLLKEALVGNARAAVEERESFEASLSAELAAVESYRERFEAIDRRRRHHLAIARDAGQTGRYDPVFGAWESLGELATEVDDLASDRQRSLDEASAAPERAFFEYLYGPLDGPTYPVLAAAAELAERLRTGRRALERRLAGPANPVGPSPRGSVG